MDRGRCWEGVSVHRPRRDRCELLCIKSESALQLSHVLSTVYGDPSVRLITKLADTSNRSSSRCDTLDLTVCFRRGHGWFVLTAEVWLHHHANRSITD